ncbi:DUF1592 domain-containing protein [Lignipirellula cremea]|uniref:Planctomycete cytochrome C n=1 Tax=Lignipirellula cremea TaxID=2528010 RepID=A0A518DYB4_9BACT|nr:DUF1592 domain-containing protein [Lignipirellula cremea]QDU96842.1 hypothetical protein Pla8534_46640 [Lignipirellula cremea]
MPRLSDLTVVSRLLRVSLLCLAALCPPALVHAEDLFQKQVAPFLQTYCQSCHNAEKTEGEFDLTAYDSAAAVGEHFSQWKHVITFLQSEEMPPADAKQPPALVRAEMIALIERILVEESRKLAGDPGVILPRRLTNAEYDYTIRDLTGVDIRPASAFPVDPASGEGFNNTGEALTMSPSLFKKYYAAAEFTADHLLLKPTGIEFAPFPVVTYADRKKYYEQAILQFYAEHQVNLEAYLTAVLSFQQRPDSKTTIEQWAGQHGLSPRYLARLSQLLSGDADEPFYLGQVRRRWQAILAPRASTADAEKQTAAAIALLARDIEALSQRLCSPETKAIVSNAGNGPIQHIDRRTQTAAARDTLNEQLLQAELPLSLSVQNLKKRETVRLTLRLRSGPDGQPGVVKLRDLNFSSQPPDNYRPQDDRRNLPLVALLEKHAPDQLRRLKAGKPAQGQLLESGELLLASPGELELELPAQAFADESRLFFYTTATLDTDQTPGGLVLVTLLDPSLSPQALAVRETTEANQPLVDPQHPIAAKWKASATAFCATFPNRFVFVDDTRGLSAGFHLIEGFFRDDQPLCKLVLDEEQNQELDRLWNELEFGTNIAEKLLRGFVFFERSERNFLKHPDFNGIKEEDPALVETAKLEQFRDIYLQRSNVKATGEELARHPISQFFAWIQGGIEQRAEQLAAAEPIYLQQLEELAQRVYRRPLDKAELAQLRSFYYDASRQPEFGVEQAVRASVIRMLMSPYFCYLLDPPPEGDTVADLPDLALASRLSYFLWSSTPDAELLELAAAGRLHEEDVLSRQTHRMLRDPKVSAFAREFFGQWLGYRDFLDQESVNRAVYRDFDDELKQAMYEEPTRLITYLIQQDLPITDLLHGDVTLINRRLSKHYGLPFDGDDQEWRLATGLQSQGRGGLLGMAVVLTKNSQPERTSPVKRGFWVVHKLLGQHIPPPPPDVAVLPKSETDTAGQTIRQLLELHTDDVKCARCHQRFDPVGLSMEGFDAIGKLRTKDGAGRPIDNLVETPGGKALRGVPEFSAWLAEQRRQEFVDTLCRKLLGYALGRSLLQSDQPLLEQMQTALLQHEDRFEVLLQTVIASPQFRQQRCRDFSASRYRTELQGEEE